MSHAASDQASPDGERGLRVTQALHHPFTSRSRRDNGSGPAGGQPDEPMSVSESGVLSETSVEAEVLRAGQLEVRPGESLVLARRRDRIVSREALYAAAWGGDLRSGDRSIDVYVRKLRVKLARALPGWQCIHTHVGFGYRFSPERSHLFHTDATPR